MNLITRLAAVVVVGAVAIGGALFGLRGQGPSAGSQTAPPGIAPTAPPSIAPTAPPTIEGTWETTFSHAQLRLAGLADSGEDIPENYGHFVLSIHGGRALTVQLSEPRTGGSAGTYVVNGNTYTVTTPAGETFSWTFTVTPTTLTFSGSGPVTLRVQPWTRIGP